MLLDDTKHKLNEANFFIDKTKSSLRNPLKLSFYLSAFLSSARSITFSMQKEFGNNSRYLIWYKEKQEEMKKDETFSIFRDLRNITVKEGKLEFNRRINVFIPEKISSGDSVSFQVIRKGEVIRESEPQKPPIKQCNSKNSTSVTQPDKVEVFLNNAPGREGIELCDQYLNKLRKMVSDAEKMINDRH